MARCNAGQNDCNISKVLSISIHEILKSIFKYIDNLDLERNAYVCNVSLITYSIYQTLTYQFCTSECWYVDQCRMEVHYKSLT